MTPLGRSLRTAAPAAVIFVRLLAGSVFLAEGIKKFLFAAQWGAGRFEHIGIPNPQFMGPFVGAFEVSCGLLVILGLATRLAAVPLTAVICTAIATTKIPILLHSGFWEMEDKARTDYSMLMSLIFLLIVGAGRWSLDAWITSRRDGRRAGLGG